MIGISKLYCGTIEPGDALRYGARGAQPADRKPVVVWNCTRRCNLRCVHCYSESRDVRHPGEMTTDEGFALLEDLAEFGCPAVLLSGGEPLMRGDLLELIARAGRLGLRVVLSTNGTLIQQDLADRLRRAGIGYVGVSLDGMREANDSLRGVKGAFDLALGGIRNCIRAGLKVGLRFTISQRNVGGIDAIFDLVRDENISRVCFYHLVYAGRGASLAAADLDHRATRRVVDLIIDRTAELHASGPVGTTEVLTVDNHADGPYVYLRLSREDPARAAEALELLRANGGNASGVRLACVRPNGDVLPDQFSDTQRLGNVRDRPFGEIWTDESNELLAALRRFPRQVTGRCSRCRWLEACNGNLRARAQAATGDFWASDPSCHLTDEEIGRAG